MRLICPNCGAQYEVEDAVIPAQGRDVQCSNCGHTWFQQPAQGGIDDDHDPDQDPDDAGGDQDLGTDLDTDQAEPPDASELEPDPGLERPQLDPEVARLLREEAAREAAARRAEAEGIETQGDLGLPEGERSVEDRSATARARMARLRGGEDGAADEAAGAAVAHATAGSRKELLPDVEEINSSLRPTEERDSEEQATMGPDPTLKVERTRKGGRLGFQLVLILVLIAIAVYVYAPFIVQYLPQAEPALTSYVAFVNGLREQLTELILRGVSGFQSLTGGGGATSQ